MKTNPSHLSNPALGNPVIQVVLQPMVKGVQSILGERLVGIYLEGSLANGGFDAESDIDFVVVIESEPDENLFLALQSLHDTIARVDSPWAVQLEGSYLSRQAVWAYDPALTLYPNIERGRGERLKLARYDPTWNVHRHILRERGLTLLGPPPQTLVDPVSQTRLRQAMEDALGWAEGLLRTPERIGSRGYQSYIVLTLCRILYTLEEGDVVSKQTAAAWAQGEFGAPWTALIDRAWEGRSRPDGPLSAEDLSLTFEMIRFALERAGR